MKKLLKIDESVLMPEGCLSLPNQDEADEPQWLTDWLERESRKYFGEGYVGGTASDSEPILKGFRNLRLTSMAGAMRRAGFTYEAIETALNRVDETRCDPPMGIEDVRKIAESVCRYGPDPPLLARIVSTGRLPGAERPNADTSNDPLDADATAFDLICANATIRWAWEKYLPLGVLSILASEPGVGKTRFCADLARRVALGLPWPDGSANPFPAGSRTLWVAADNQHVELGSIPTAFGFMPDLLYLNTTKRNLYSGTMLDTPEELKDFEDRILRVNPVLIFIDTCLMATERTSHKTEDARAFFAPLQQIASRSCGDRVMLCSTHLNAAGKPLGRRIMGQGRLVMQLDCPDPDGQPTRRALRVIKSNSLMPPALGVTMGDGGNEYDADPPKAPETEPGGMALSAAAQAAAKWLSDLLKKGPSRVCNTRTAAEAAGINPRDLYAAKGHLSVSEFTAEGYKCWRLEAET